MMPRGWFQRKSDVRHPLPMRSIFDLTTAEAYRIVSEHFGHALPPLDAVENEDWGRDYVLEHFLKHTAEELAAVGLTLEPADPCDGGDPP